MLHKEFHYTTGRRPRRLPALAQPAGHPKTGFAVDSKIRLPEFLPYAA
jgi:hypothetical protein